MVEINKIYNEDCIETMCKIEESSVNIILTSPPYNTSRPCAKSDAYSYRYDGYCDKMGDEEYISFITKCFLGYDRILKNDGIVLFNISYSSENSWLIWDVISRLQGDTNFIVADCIVWKKRNAIPNNVSPNKLTRICEFVFVFCKKDSYSTFFMNKKVDSVSAKGQNIYENLFNFVEAANNDGSCDLNKATFSTEFARKLLRMYGKKNFVVYDSFMGTGTTALAAIKENMSYIGSELSSLQCDYANKRIDNENKQIKWF